MKAHPRELRNRTEPVRALDSETTAPASCAVPHRDSQPGGALKPGPSRPSDGCAGRKAAQESARSQADVDDCRLRVLLVDDSPVFLTSLRRLLTLVPGLDVVGQLPSAESLLEHVARLEPDLVLMDIAMPGIDGFEATRHLRALERAPHVVIISMHDLPNYRKAALSAGADAFVSKLDLGESILPLVIRLIGELHDRTL